MVNKTTSRIDLKIIRYIITDGQLPQRVIQPIYDLGLHHQNRIQHELASMVEMDLSIEKLWNLGVSAEL